VSGTEDAATDSEDGETVLSDRPATDEASPSRSRSETGTPSDEPVVSRDDATTAESQTRRQAVTSRLRPSLPRPTTTETKMNVAPLLGMGFLAISAAVVRWATRGRDRET
jgi:hypothetical protein